MDPSWMEVKEEADLESPFRFEGLRGKVRFSFAEIKVLLEEVKNHRFVVLKKFNSGVSSETKKQTWSEITDKVNSLGVTVREVRQIMKKWADLKCDARRRMLAMRAPKGHKKTLGPVEVMVQKILLLAPGKDEAELDIESFEEYSPTETESEATRTPPPPLHLLPQGGACGHGRLATLRSRTSPPDAPPPALPPSPPGAGPGERLARVAAQSLVQQQVGGALLGSVSRSLELLAAAVQQLVETQQDFISESLEQQRHTLDVLKDFSHNALSLLRDRPPAHARLPPSHTPGPPTAHYQPLDQNQHLVHKNQLDQSSAS
ncbi:unnamed protein product [Gadus morhua 'NCC']